MKAYVKNADIYEFPEDMKIIVDYLSANGTINVNERMLEQLYRSFSDSVFCAQWMNPRVETLEQFADWLKNIEITSVPLASRPYRQVQPKG